jgi:hypothetical protein
MYKGMMQGKAAKIAADRINKALNATAYLYEATLAGQHDGRVLSRRSRLF